MARKIVSAEEVAWMLASGWTITDKTTDGKYEVEKPTIVWLCYDGGFWFRLFSHGVSVQNTMKHSLLSSEMKKRGFCIGKWRVNFF